MLRIQTIVIVLLGLITLNSCNSEEDKENNPQPESVDVLPVTEDTVSEVVEKNPQQNEEAINSTDGHLKIENPFDRVAGTYWKLTYSEGRDPYIYHFCEAEVPQVSIDIDEQGTRRFIIGLGQDSQIYEVLSIEGESYEMELYQVADYSLQVINKFDETDKPTIKVLVNEDDGTSFFEGTELFHDTYARDDFAKDLDHEYENCDYMDDY